MTRIQEVHLRLLSTLPVRTHERKYEEDGTGSVPRGRSLVQTEQLHFRIKALAKRGLKRYQIAEELNVSRTTVQRHLDGQIRAVSR